MKILLTGSLGNIGKPLTKELVQKGHTVTVISNNSERQQDIEALGAKAVIGSMQNIPFLTKTFKGADVVYLMEPPVNFFDKSLDIIHYYENIGKNYAQAIEQSGVKQVVHLSSIGAHMDRGNGVLQFHYRIEQILRKLPNNIVIKFIRPVGFYYNLLSMVRSIKSFGMMASTYGENDIVPWVSPLDIADAIVGEIEMPFNQTHKVRYVASDELTCNDVAKAFGEAIGIPDLKWVIIPEKQQLDGMLMAGMNTEAATGLVEMNNATHTGELYEDYMLNKPALGKVKIKDFAKEFAATFNNS